MVISAPARSPKLGDVPGLAGEFPENEVLAQIQIPPRGDDPAASKRREAEQLVATVGGRRSLLERLRSRFLRRLHRASDDLEATEGLRVAEAALSLMPRPAEPWAGQVRGRRRRGRPSWRRRSAQ